MRRRQPEEIASNLSNKPPLALLDEVRRLAAPIRVARSTACSVPRRRGHRHGSESAQRPLRCYLSPSRSASVPEVSASVFRDRLYQSLCGSPHQELSHHSALGPLLRGSVAADGVIPEPSGLGLGNRCRNQPAMPFQIEGPDQVLCQTWAVFNGCSGQVIAHTNLIQQRRGFPCGSGRDASDR